MINYRSLAYRGPVFGYFLLIALGIAFCAGCGDSSTQPWENGKSQASAGKSSGKTDEVVNNDAGGQTENPALPENHPATENHPAAENSHAGMAMPGEGASKVIENDGKLDLGTTHWTVPKTWVRKSPNMILKAEYAIPHAEGDKNDARLTVSHVGGSIEDNIGRWKKQFGNKHEDKSSETIQVAGAKVTLINLAGTFDDPGNMMGPPVIRPGYRMIGAAVEISGDQEAYYIKCYGPEKTMAAHADEVNAFIKSMKVDK